MIWLIVWCLIGFICLIVDLSKRGFLNIGDVLLVTLLSPLGIFLLHDKILALIGNKIQYVLDIKIFERKKK